MRVDFPDPELPTMAPSRLARNRPLTLFKMLFFSEKINYWSVNNVGVSGLPLWLCPGSGRALTRRQGLRGQRVPDVDSERHIGELHVHGLHCRRCPRRPTASAAGPRRFSMDEDGRGRPSRDSSSVFSLSTTRRISRRPFRVVSYPTIIMMAVDLDEKLSCENACTKTGKNY